MMNNTVGYQYSLEVKSFCSWSLIGRGNPFMKKKILPVSIEHFTKLIILFFRSVSIKALSKINYDLQTVECQSEMILASNQSTEDWISGQKKIQSAFKVQCHFLIQLCDRTHTVEELYFYMASKYIIQPLRLQGMALIIYVWETW